MSIEDHLYPLLRYYERAPSAVRAPLGALYRTLPAHWRYGRRYNEFQSLARALTDATPDDIAQWQLRQIQTTLQAAQTCSFYQRHFAAAGVDPAAVRSLADFKTCPLLTKRDLQQSRDAMITAGSPPRNRLYVTTGGSTGEPVGFYLQRGVSRPKEQAFIEALWQRAGYRPGARVAVLRGHVTSPTAGGRIHYRDTARNWLILSSAHLTEDRLPEYLEALDQYQPDFLHIYPSAALQLAAYLHRTRQTWRQPLQALLCGSEQLTLGQKQLLADTFHCRVLRWYGHSERVVLAGEGAESPLLYFFPTYGYVEFGEPDSDGLCEIIGTSFHNHVMPLIRYRTGDYARPAPDAAAREWPWPAVEAIVGRAQEFLVSAGGRRISLTAFNMHDAVFDGLYAVQFVQTEPGRARFCYVPGPGFDPARLALIEKRIREKLGDDFTVELTAVRHVQKTARGKHRWLVNEGENKP